MIAASVIAIFLIPVTFDVVEKLSHRATGGKKRKQLEQPASPEGKPL
jgi:hypothetical protein